MNYDNPAARLHSIVELGKQEATNQSCRDVWHRLLKTGGDNCLLMSRLGKLYELPGGIKVALEEQFPSYLRHANHLLTQTNNAFMAQNLNDNWATFINHIDSHSVSYLAFVSEILQSKANTKTIADDQILDLRERLDGLYKEVLEGDIPDDIKAYLVRYLRRIINSIDEYFLTGAFPILEATGTLLGHVFVDEKYRSFLRNEPLGAKIFECLTAAANIVTVAVGLPQLSAAIALLN